MSDPLLGNAKRRVTAITLNLGVVEFAGVGPSSANVTQGIEKGIPIRLRDEDDAVTQEWISVTFRLNFIVIRVNTGRQI